MVLRMSTRIDRLKRSLVPGRPLVRGLEWKRACVTDPWVCAAPACDRVFVDVARDAQRRFCSPRCQSRVKAAAHRARKAAS
jgi:predicted RNA-binding Zn ribbon-like protein